MPLDHGIVSVTEAGIEPAKSRDSRPRRFACLRTRPRSSRGRDQRCASVPDSNPQTGCAAACFQNRVLIRPDDFRSCKQAPGVGIEPTASWFRARRHYQQQLPRNTSWIPLPRIGSGRGNRTPIAWFKARKRTVSPSPLVQSALRESNPPVQLGRLVPEPIGQGHVSSRRKERESNPQGSNARPASNALAIAHWLALPLHPGCGGRNRTCVRAINSRLPVPAQDPPHRIVQSGRPDLNRRSRAPKARGVPGFPTS